VRRFHQPGPQGLAGLLFGLKTLGAHKAAAITCPAVLEADRMNLAIAIERMIAANRFMHRHFTGTDIDAINIIGNDTDHLRITVGENGVPFLERRAPGPLHIGMVS